MKSSSLRPPQRTLAAALQEDQGDLFFITSVENRETPLYLALSTLEATFLHAQYIAWLALSDECRSLRTEAGLPTTKYFLNPVPTMLMLSVGDHGLQS